MADETGLEGRRILVVEDDMMISMMLEDMLLELGCQVLGPANRLDTALELAQDAVGVDAAILDINLGGQPVFPVADALRARGVPLIFSTGYGDDELRHSDRGCAILRKPYRAHELAAALRETLAVPGPKPV